MRTIAKPDRTTLYNSQPKRRLPKLRHNQRPTHTCRSTTARKSTNVHQRAHPHTFQTSRQAHSQTDAHSPPPPATQPHRLVRVPLRIGTDCSGIEAPVMALRLLGIPHEHIFSAEIDSHARQSIRANYSPAIEYDDIFQRDAKTIPDIDLYVCGFPCQSFSTVNAGGQQGFYQEHNKGIIFFQCYTVICHPRRREHLQSDTIVCGQSLPVVHHPTQGVECKIV